MKSELQRLRDESNKKILALEGKVADFELEVYDLETQIENLNGQIDELECSELPSDSLVDQQKLDLLKEHWESITVEDIEAICPISLAYKS